MNFSQSAAVNVVPLLARLVLAATFIPLGWSKIANENEVFTGEAAQILIDLKVASPVSESEAPASGTLDLQSQPAIEQGNDSATGAAASDRSASGAESGVSPDAPTPVAPPAPSAATPAPTAAAEEVSVQARALYGSAVKLVKAGWPKSWKPEQIAWLGALTELLGGVSILLGLFSRVWAIGMVLSRGFALYLTSWPAIAKYSLFALPAAEYNQLIATMAILVLAVGVALTGPGAVSLDRAVFRRTVPQIKPLPTPKL